MPFQGKQHSEKRSRLTTQLYKIPFSPNETLNAQIISEIPNSFIEYLVHPRRFNPKSPIMFNLLRKKDIFLLNHTMFKKNSHTRILEKVINPDHQMKKSNWAVLPTKIPRMIMEKLFWSERLPSCLVRKTWHECFLGIQNEQQFLPWVLSYGRGGICRLGDPSVREASSIVKETKIDLLDDAVACASRHGWVLFEKKLDDPDNTLTDFYNQYFLYSPFTDEVIKFPKLKMGHCRKATLFQSPSSPGSMVVISFSTLYTDLRIKTCHPGDKSWKILEFKFGSRPCGYEYERITDLACAGDFVYCVLTERELGSRPKDDKCYTKMGAFNIKQQDWKVFSGFLPDNSNCWYHCLSVTFKGDILVQISNINRRRMQFWRFDLSEEKWVDVDDEIIKKQVIFKVRCTSYPEGYTSFTVPAVRDARQYAGMVFSLDADYFRYPYNFTCYPFDHTPDSYLLDARQDNDEIINESHQWVNEDYKWLKEDCKQFKMIWIQPPFQRILKMN